jgi:hypothetical protein
MPDWRKIGSALTSAEAALPDNANAPADRWIEATAGTLALDPLEARMLALALYYKLDQRVERLFDAASEYRGPITRFHRDSGLIALLLHVSSSPTPKDQCVGPVSATRCLASTGGRINL